ncbi:MAG: hypothetical protein Q4E75_03890 [bacterium]|nr:hypothetical protein [bacterium]
MLRKLLKYNIKDMYKPMIIFYVLTIFFALTTRILISINQTFIINILGKISMGCFFSMIFSALINTLIRNWVRFKDFFYSDESYLTHTLPVTKNKLYESRFLLSVINLATTFIIIIISLLIAYYSKDNFEILIKNISNLTNSINVSFTGTIIYLVLILFLEIFNGLQSGFLGIIIGYSFNNYKFGLSVLFGFITYFVTQILVLFIIFIFGLFNKDIMLMFTSSSIINFNVLKQVAIITLILYVFITALINILCLIKLNKGVNVD